MLMSDSDRCRLPYGGRSREDYERLLEGKVSHENLRLTLAFAGLFQLAHEMLKYAILGKVRGFYLRGFDETGMLYDEISYKAQVLEQSQVSGQRANAFRGSVLWLVQHDAITDEDAKTIDAIYKHRHELTHELAAFLVDVDRYPDAAMFQDATAILRKIHRFWIEVELQSGGFFSLESGEAFDDVDGDEITPLSIALLQECIDAVVAGISETQEI